MLKRLWFEGLVSMGVLAWASLGAGLICTMDASQVSAQNYYVAGCANSAPCPMVVGNCAGNGNGTAGRCTGWGFLCLSWPNQCPGNDLVTGLPCSVKSGC
jgi:hypothetical protein